MAFSANPLSLSVPDPYFESWLRDTGYLDILDSAAAATETSPSPPPPPLSLSSSVRTLISVLTLNPFARLTTADLAGPTPSWAHSFISRPADYSLPAAAGPTHARMRVQENVRRYARNYALLSLLLLACSLYRSPSALLGSLSVLALWESLRYAGARWDPDQRFPILREVLVRLAQLATAVILYACNIQVTLLYTIGISYAVITTDIFIFPTNLVIFITIFFIASDAYARFSSKAGPTKATHWL